MNLIHLKRAIHKIPSEFNSVQFNSEETVLINGKSKPDFEFAPEDYDYSDRNEHIDQAFAVYLSKPFIYNKSFSANHKNGHVTITVRHDDEITFISTYKK
jgi:hypothetical protein